ncbi:MAG: SpoIIE family protein phosphatase [Spirochaetales bacterium]|nr:SpoIIE family protein phosphatase [Spirochaetales bacterium]
MEENLKKLNIFSKYNRKVTNSVYFKISISLIVIISIITGVETLIYSQISNTFLIRMAKRETRISINSIEKFSIKYLEEDKIDELQDFLHKLAEDPILNSIRIYKEDSEIIASSESGERGITTINNTIRNIAKNKSDIIFYEDSENLKFSAYKKFFFKEKNNTTLAILRYEPNMELFSQNYNYLLYINTIFSIATLIFIALALISVSYFWVTKPINQLRVATEAVSIGDFNIKLENSYPSEISYLFDAFKSMTKSRFIIEQQLKHKIKFDSILIQTSAKFVNIHEDEISSAVRNTLERVGNTINAELGFILLLTNKPHPFKELYYWEKDINKTMETFSKIEILKKYRKEIPNLYNSSTIFPLINEELMTALPNIAIPLIDDKKTIGLLGFESSNPQNKSLKITGSLELFAELLVNLIQRQRAENNLRNTHDSILSDLKTAEKIQKYMIPGWFQVKNKVYIASNYSPSIKIGGDVFDIINITKNKWAMIIGDVSGHGIQAALIMAAVKSALRALIQKEINISPAEVLNRFNEMATEELLKKNFLTILLSIVDMEKMEMTYYNAGHPPILKYNRKKGVCEYLKETGGIPIGWMKDYNYNVEDEVTAKIEYDDIFLFYTDGIFETKNQSGEEFGLERLRFIFSHIAAKESIIIPNMIKSEIGNLDFATFHDDFTLVTLSFEDFKMTSKENEKLLQHTISKDKKVLLLHFNANINELPAIRERSSEFLQTKTKNQDCIFKALLAIVEFITNIIDHGTNHNRTSEIVLTIEVEDEEIKLCFYDKGIEWSPELNRPETYTIASEKLYATSGRGLQIIESFSREFIRERFADTNKTQIRILIE